MLEIEQKSQASEKIKKGKLNLVDLSGSEKVVKTRAEGDILEEAKKINFSLSCLGNVIHSITTKGKNDHIPYRDSKLTRLLQESLGGNFKTSLLVTCSSHYSSLDETVSTLKFAARAKNIKNHYKMNITSSPDSLQKIILQLKKELVLANRQLAIYKQMQGSTLDNSGTCTAAQGFLSAPYANRNVKSNNQTHAPSQQGLLEDSDGQPDSGHSLAARGSEPDLQQQLRHYQFLEGELGQKCQALQMKVMGQEREISELSSKLQQQDQTVKKLREDLSQAKKESISYETLITQIKDERDAFKVSFEKSASNADA